MNLQAHDLEAIAERRCVTLANLWERNPEGPTWIWGMVSTTGNVRTMVKG
jgi:hypothetical protein